MGYTLTNLIALYRTDAHSPFQRLGYQARVKQHRMMERISEKHGHLQLRGVKSKTLLAWYKDWSSGGRIAAGHALIGRLRTLFRFGFTILEDDECLRLLEILRESRFRTQGPRLVQLTSDHVKAIRAEARAHFGWYSIALAQALQFELRLSQKDVIGEWVPIAEPDESDVIWQGKKWVRGLCWSHIDKNLVLRHTTGSAGKLMEADLRTAPMILDELGGQDEIIRLVNEGAGPIVINDVTGMPWSTAEYRRKWRLVARKAGVPEMVKNRDSVPASTLVGGPDRARVSRHINLTDLHRHLRSRRR
jgi:hypothetical protein